MEEAGQNDTRKMIQLSGVNRALALDQGGILPVVPGLAM